MQGIISFNQNNALGISFRACNCLFGSRNCLLTSRILGHCYKLNWPKRVSAVHWLLGTLPYPCLFVNILGIYCFLVFLCACVTMLVPNCPGAKWSGAKFSTFLSWCQIVHLLSWCQIIRFYYLVAKLSVPYCPGPKLSCAKLSYHPFDSFD